MAKFPLSAGENAARPGTQHQKMFHAVGSLGSRVKLQEENRASDLEKILRLVTLIADSQQLSPWAGTFLVLASAPPRGAVPPAVNSPADAAPPTPPSTAHADKMPFPPHSDSNIQLVPQGRSGFPPASLTDNQEYLSKHLENFLPLISLFWSASQPKPSDVL